MASLLNPATEEVRPLPSPRRTQTPSDGGFALSLPPFKKPKMSKDAAVFAEGKVRSPVRYPPWEDYNQEVIQELKKFNLYPLGRIAKYHRHIPYNSDKKAFWEKTGRGAFEGWGSCQIYPRQANKTQSSSIHSKCLAKRKSTT